MSWASGLHEGWASIPGTGSFTSALLCCTVDRSEDLKGLWQASGVMIGNVRPRCKTLRVLYCGCGCKIRTGE